jgi:hypothetical protein
MPKHELRSRDPLALLDGRQAIPIASISRQRQQVAPLCGSLHGRSIFVMVTSSAGCAFVTPLSKLSPQW